MVGQLAKLCFQFVILLPRFSWCIAPLASILDCKNQIKSRFAYKPTKPQYSQCLNIHFVGCYIVTSCNTLMTLLTKFPASSRSRCHFLSHSEIPGTYVSHSNLDALPVMPSTDMSRCFRILWIMEDI